MSKLHSEGNKHGNNTIARFKEMQEIDYNIRFQPLSNIQQHLNPAIEEKDGLKPSTPHDWQAQLGERRQQLLASPDYAHSIWNIRKKHYDISEHNHLGYFVQLVAGRLVFNPEILAQRKAIVMRRRNDKYYPISSSGSYLRKQKLAEAEAKLGWQPLDEPPKRRMSIQPCRLTKTASVEALLNKNQEEVDSDTDEEHDSFEEERSWSGENGSQEALLKNAAEFPRSNPKRGSTGRESILEVKLREKARDRIRGQLRLQKKKGESDGDGESSSDGEVEGEAADGQRKIETRGTKDEIKGRKVEFKRFKKGDNVSDKTSIAESFPRRNFF